MTDTDEYGFFCDIETAKIAEYDKHKYYILTKKTHWEVRRMPIESENAVIPAKHKSVDALQIKRHGLGNAEDTIEDADYTLYYEECQKKLENGEYQEDEPETQKCVCFIRSLSFFRRIPREIYYSIAICVTTISCVCFVMTFPIDK